MAHPDERRFMELVKSMFPNYFKNIKVLDVGSLNVNGTNKDLFEDCEYTGIDVGEGKNVDIVSLAHEFKSDILFDTIISSECFEHDCHFEKSIKNIVSLLKPSGLFVWTAGGTYRAPHGGASCTPLIASNPKMDSNYYKNITAKDYSNIIDLEAIFGNYTINYRGEDVIYHDIQFYGIKRK